MDGGKRLIVIGASSGGLAALKQLFSRLPPDFPAPILVTMHIGKSSSMLPHILSGVSRLPVRHPKDGEPILDGHILIAPPDHHLLVEDDRVRVLHGPKENHSRPAIDPLFRSAAIAHGARVIGVVLTGDLDDGTVGLQAIKNYGGIAMVQNPREAEAASMPQSALQYVEIDYCLPLHEIANTLVRLSYAPLKLARPAHDNPDIIMENRFVTNEDLGAAELDKLGSRSDQTCPECGGILWEMHDGPPLRFRCHTGHAFTGRALMQVQNRMSEDVLWSAVRALHEKHTLMLRMAQEARKRNAEQLAAEHEASAELAARHAEALRTMISEANGKAEAESA
jgi:two-component system chemotaxis response regulator CheB